MTKEEIVQGLYKGDSRAIKEAIQALEQQPSDDCISRQAVIEYIEACGAELGHDLENESVREDILNMPSVTPTRKVVKLIAIDDTHSQCMECGAIFCITSSDWWEISYCPNCGASFKEEKRGDSYGSN